ncbi:translation initiation factor IF-2-like [Lutra lutra]|uniref:translation initiation factor IF-2-like n=1 Tax=Lutra lutra TaxID=9657 RepID=UPI001FD15EF1|nr:translation initiation factor IF-2-like [Lutra lutra]
MAPGVSPGPGSGSHASRVRDGQREAARREGQEAAPRRVRRKLLPPGAAGSPVSGRPGPRGQTDPAERESQEPASAARVPHPPPGAQDETARRSAEPRPPPGCRCGGASGPGLQGWPTRTSVGSPGFPRPVSSRCPAVP